MKIETKFSLGDQVWSGEGCWQKKYKQCPDCLGKKYFNVSTPAGELFKSACPTCSEGWASTGRVREYGFSPLINHLTIGLVRVDVRMEETVEEYMAEETGIGSGRVWKAGYLFPTREEALVFAQAEGQRKAKEMEVEKEKDRKLKKEKMRAYK